MGAVLQITPQQPEQALQEVQEMTAPPCSSWRTTTTTIITATLRVNPDTLKNPCWNKVFLNFQFLLGVITKHDIFFFFLNNGIMTCYSASTWLMCIRLFFSQNSTGYSEILLFQKQWIVTRNRLQRPSQVKMLKWNSVGRIRIHSRKTLRRFLYFVLTF